MMRRWLRTLRAQFALALGAMLLLVLASGTVGVIELLQLSQQVQQVTRTRLDYFNDAQELLERTRQLELYATSRRMRPDKDAQGYQTVLRNLDELDRLTARLSISEDAQVLDLHESSQLFRSTMQVVAQLLELPPEAGDETRVAQQLQRSTDDMQRHAARMVETARQQSDAFSRAYQDSMAHAAEVSRRSAGLVALLAGASVGAAWLIAHFFLGQRVVGRLQVVSAWLRDRNAGVRGDETVRVPVGGHDEVAEMARAVELSVQDRQQLAHAQRALEDSRSRLEAIFDNTADAIVVIHECRVRQMNAAAHRLFGLRADAGPGLPVDSLLLGNDLSTARGLAGVAQEAIALGAHGVQVPVEVTVSEVRTAEGVLTIVVLRDATLHREAERHLREARNAAEAARAAQAALLSSMNHELRTPLNGVLGYAQLLALAPNLTEAQRQQLAVIESSGQHLLSLVNDALDLAKHEAGKAELEVISVDLARTARAVADIVGLRAEQSGLSFECEVDPRLPCSVRADDRRLRQVLLNLLANAVKFTDRGGHVRLVLSLQDTHDGMARVRFEVRDTGIGMTPEQVAAIFEPFSQFGSARTRAQGTGLGMAISQQLVRLMGGEIAVHSQPAGGSSFCFELELPVLPVEDESLSR